jgi:hypothetical protein
MHKEGRTKKGGSNNVNVNVNYVNFKYGKYVN